MGITLDRSVWHTRLFFWTLDVCDYFLNKKYYGNMGYYSMANRYSCGTNLCHYVRVITVYLPLVLATHLLLVASTIYVLLLLPIRLFGALGYAFSILHIFGALLALIIAFTILAFGVVGLGKAKDITVKVIETRRKLPDDQPSAVELIKLWVKAKKQKICPLISFIRTSGQEG